MAQSIALMALTALGLFGPSSHEPFHADGGQKSTAVTERSGQTLPQRRRNLPWSDRAVEQVDHGGVAVRIFFTVIKGAPSARQAAGPGRRMRETGTDNVNERGV